MNIQDKESKSFDNHIKYTSVRVNDISQSTRANSVSGEALTLSAGAAGTTGRVRLRYAPIMDSIAGGLGWFETDTNKDTSLSITHAALAGDEVRLKENTSVSDIYAQLSNGDYAVDYTKSVIYYKKGTADTAGTVDYIYTTQDVNVSIGDVNIGDVTSGGVNIATQTTAAAILAKQTDKQQMTQITDGTDELLINSDGSLSAVLLDDSGNSISSTDYAGDKALNVHIKGGATLEVNLDNENDDVLIYGFDGSANQKVSTATDGRLKSATEISAVETLVTEQDLTDTYVDFGAEIPYGNYSKLGVWVEGDVNDSENVDLRIIGLHTTSGDEFEIDGVSEKSLWTTAATDFKKYYEIEVGAVPIIKLQAKAGTVGATAGDLTIKITKVQ